MRLSQTHGIVPVLRPAADRYNTDPTSAYVKMTNYQHATFILDEGAGGTGTALITMLAASDSAGTGAEAIAFPYRVYTTDVAAAEVEASAAGYTTVAGANKMVVVEVDAAKMPDGKPWLAMDVTEVANSPVEAAIYAILSRARYAGETMPTALS